MRDISVSDKGSRRGRKKDKNPSSSQRRAKSDWDGKSAGIARNTKVIAFGSNGETIIFDSIKEASDFFGFERTDTFKRYIDSSFPMPDGTTFCDYLV